MANYQITLDEQTLQRLFTSDRQLAHLLEAILNQVLEAQVGEQLHAERYERTDERQGYRNGYKSRQLTTRVGALTLRVPQVREGGFSPELFARYQRSEQALILTLMEMVINGVSTRKVARITEELCGTSFSKSTVSELCKGLDPLVEAWNERDLGATRFPFVFVDALLIKVREDGQVRSCSALLATGVNEEGYREILGVQLGDSESERSWTDFFRWLKSRGLRGVDLVVSDNHGGLTAAVRVQFQGASWQRCQMHLSANISSAAPRWCKRSCMPASARSSRRPICPPPARSWPRSSLTMSAWRRPRSPPWSAASTTRPPCWRCPGPIVSGCAPSTAKSGSTKKCVGASASSASSPTARPRSACWEPSSWSTMNSGAPASAIWT